MRGSRQLANAKLQIPGRLFELSGSITFFGSKIKHNLKNYIYLLICKHCGIQYVGESITPVNLRINIRRKSKSGCEPSIYKNVWEGASFLIHILEKLGDGFINGPRDFSVQKLRMQSEDYWMKKRRAIYERAKNSNLEQPTGTLFQLLPRFGNRREKRCVNDPTKLDPTDTLLAYIATFPPKTKSDNFRKIVEGMKQKNLRKLASNATDDLKTCDDTKKNGVSYLLIFFN